MLGSNDPNTIPDPTRIRCSRFGLVLMFPLGLRCVWTYTGDKGWCTGLVHSKYTARTWTKYPPYTDLGTGSTFRIFQANFFAVSLVQEIPGTFTVSPVM